MIENSTQGNWRLFHGNLQCSLGALQVKIKLTVFSLLVRSYFGVGKGTGYSDPC